MGQLREVGLLGPCGKLHHRAMEDGALTSCPSLGSWHEVGEVEGSLVGVWCPGSLLGLGLTGGWLAGLVPGCVIREEKGCIVGASKDCYALTRRWLATSEDSGTLAGEGPRSGWEGCEAVDSGIVGQTNALCWLRGLLC